MTLLLFLIAFTAFILIALNLLPIAGPMPTGLSSSITSLYHLLWGWNLIFPVPTLLLVLAIGLAYHYHVYLYHLIARIFGWIRGGTS